MRSGSLIERVEGPLPSELTTVLASGRGARIERIVSRGHSSPPGFWYDQEENELVVLIAGSARLEVEGSEPIDLAPGDWVDLPAHTKHRVVRTDDAADTVWLAVFYEDS